MHINLTDIEKDIMNMLICGHNSPAIIDWYELDIKDFNKIKRNIFKKLKISRTIQILSAAIRYNII